MKRLFGVLAVALLVFTACGSDDNPTVDSSSGQSADDMDHGGGMDHGGDKDKDKCGEATTSPTLSAKSSLGFEPECISVPADTAFTLTFENREATISHNVAVGKEHRDPVPLFKTETMEGPNTATVMGGPLEPGTYHFHCEVHPVTMMGTLKVVQPSP